MRTSGAFDIPFGYPAVEEQLILKLELPASVLHYINDPAVRSSVDDLMPYNLKKMPGSIGWEDLPDYYQAQRATLQTCLETCLAMDELWRAVWQAQERSLAKKQWHALTPDEQSRKPHHTLLTPEECWDSWCLYRAYSRGNKLFMYLGTGFTEDGIRIGIGAHQERRNQLLKYAKLDPAIFEYHADDDEWWTIASDVPAEELVDLALLLERAPIMLGAITEVLSQPS